MKPIREIIRDTLCWDYVGIVLLACLMLVFIVRSCRSGFHNQEPETPVFPY